MHDLSRIGIQLDHQDLGSHLGAVGVVARGAVLFSHLLLAPRSFVSMAVACCYLQSLEVSPGHFGHLHHRRSCSSPIVKPWWLVLLKLRAMYEQALLLCKGESRRVMVKGQEGRRCFICNQSFGTSGRQQTNTRDPAVNSLFPYTCRKTGRNERAR